MRYIERYRERDSGRKSEICIETERERVPVCVRERHTQTEREEERQRSKVCVCVREIGRSVVVVPS